MEPRKRRRPVSQSEHSSGEGRGPQAEAWKEDALKERGRGRDRGPSVSFVNTQHAVSPNAHGRPGVTLFGKPS